MYVIVITSVKSRNICDGIVTIKAVTQCKKHLWSGTVESGCGELNILTIGMPCQPTYSVQFRSAVMSLQTIIFFFFFFFVYLSTLLFTHFVTLYKVISYTFLYKLYLSYPFSTLDLKEPSAPPPPPPPPQGLTLLHSERPNCMIEDRQNSEDPDQRPHNVVADHCLHCLLVGFYIKIRLKVTK